MAVEILVPKNDKQLERAIGAAKAVRFVTKPSQRLAGRILLTSLAALNDGKQRRAWEDLVEHTVRGAREVVWILIETKAAPPPDGEALQTLLHWAAKLGREPYIASGPAIVRRMILARQCSAEKELIASASIEGDKLVVWTCEPRRLEVPIAAIPSLARMKPRALSSLEVSESGSRIHWEDGDVDLSAETLRAFADPEVRREQQAKRSAEAARYADAIRALRERHGLRQADVKGLAERQVRRLEAGDTMPRAATLEKLARAHGMAIDAYLAALAAIHTGTSKASSQTKGRAGSKTRSSRRARRG